MGLPLIGVSPLPLPPTRSFDRSIEVRRPDYQGRLEGIKVHLREKPIAADIDYAELATLTGGMSGAQLAGGLAL